MTEVGGVAAASSSPAGLSGASFAAESFSAAAEASRRELLAHCYRMLGSVDEAEDVVQETFLRAWRSYQGFEGRSSVRVWLYRIATNACLTALQSRKLRPLPSGLGAPSEDPEGPPTMAEPGFGWLQPIADSRLAGRPDDPATVADRREDLRLALVASLQHLPPRQRAVLLLREVLDLPAADVGQLLGMSTAAVKSALQRARGRIEQIAPRADDVTLPTGAEERALLNTYIEAFERADAPALERALTQDAVLEVAPALSWYSGLETCMRHLRLAFGPPGTWRMLPTRANGQPAAVAYLRDGEGTHRAYGVAVLGVRRGGIERITAFGDAALVGAFGFPDTHPAR
ncbi:RNA polymerase subunit sigma-70 [Catenulispora rubra]|uniref:RNA polymerase subunit sigma-70 n=1 Tax=Catenulispora rubra TaxID=280293 RepID=UPI0018925352|nr:RNA polymerase subunit sigma-70 [Catenulispora rubra]